MPTEITITLKEIIIHAELFDTPCAKAIANILKKAKGAVRISIDK